MVFTPSYKILSADLRLDKQNIDIIIDDLPEEVDLMGHTVWLSTS
jgi:hypothetical protein